MNNQMFDIGKIINTHGIRGEVKVYQVTDFAERFNVGEKLYAYQDEKPPIELVIKSQRMHKGYHLLTFEGFNSINDVETLKNANLKINQSQLGELKQDEYYYYEIIDSDVYTLDNDWVGVVTEIMAPGANDVFVVKRESKEILIPNIKDVVKNIDVDKKRVIIDPMEGLLD